MSAPLDYSLGHALGIVSISLTSDRFIVKTKGRGLADRLRTVDIPITDLIAFTVVPTLAIQRSLGPGAGVETAFDSELIFAYTEAGKRKTKRTFVDSRHPALRAVVDTLARLRPDASLLRLDPATAQKQIGVASASKTIAVIVALLILLPIVGLIIALLTGK